MVIDGWRIDAASTDRQGMMAAALQLGYRLALICAGAGALYIAEFVDWRSAYLTMAALDGRRPRRQPSSPRVVAETDAAGRSRPIVRRSPSSNPWPTSSGARALMLVADPAP